MLNIISHNCLISLLICLLVAKLSMAQPYEAYPVNKQLPPIARIDETFSFTISNDTYLSEIDKNVQIVYDAYNLPSWLSFDSSSRTFTGTPSSSFLENDESTRYFNFTLQGTDPDDTQSLNVTYQLVVSNQSSVEIASNFNLLALLKNYGNTNGKDGLILSPYEVFNVTFDRSTFTNDTLITEIYGRSYQYNAPLPNWLSFDATTLKFSGTAPVVNSDIAPEMYYPLVLIASEIEGYSSCEVEFQLIVGGHQLTTSIQNTILINVTDSGSFDYDIPLNYVYLDDVAINSTGLGSIELLDAPSWVTLNNTTLSGTMANDSSTGNFSVAVYDIYEDVIYLNFEVESTSDLFAVSSLPNINATRGEWFEYTFLPSQFTDFSDTNVSITFTNTSQSHSWLSFMSSNLTMQGETPSDLEQLNVGLIASKGSKSQELDFQIIGMNAIASKNSTNSTTNHTLSHTSASSSTISSSNGATSATRSSSASATASGTVSGISTKKNNKKTIAIACGVAIPVGVIIILIILILLWRTRKQNRKDEDKEKNVANPSLGNPTITPVNNPFDDSDTDDGEGKNINMLNAIKLDESSSSESDASTLREKKASSQIYNDLYSEDNNEALLPNSGDRQKRNTEFTLRDGSSSIYIDSEALTRKSWRFNPDNNMDKRDSSFSLNTVSTAEFLNTEIKNNQELPKDPRKSSLGLRDSVFMDRSTNENNVVPNRGSTVRKDSTLEPLREEQDKHNSESKTPTTVSTESLDDFIPIKKGNEYKWVQINEPNRRPSQKRFVSLDENSHIDVGQSFDIEGEIPERI
ncbi:hypothetical protein KAFR_0J01790 [Kazachstania africana CBS 2517]|uniref:Dystroglycan-type cadherin-like domain-containing protein n=1 Tax=Kazachstania africana (strain ATCC 22294 / BCRC 22015 / CBS 2517 / CECT 1963 / NBRC 1671 / NRRL Y-8276) TaxID=1071382 RepID=H2B0U3_KAZAF|nr:hypothetical protein KAFR_0J01790 [Kazachstania africana CBS 2517]CCF60243.1 hypothetical protein KAFR_0J01790 [Kazachstania africana CBS 2517]